MGKVIEMELSDDKKTLLETISAYEGMLNELQVQIEALHFGLGVLRRTVKELGE